MARGAAPLTKSTVEAFLQRPLSSISVPSRLTTRAGVAGNTDRVGRDAGAAFSWVRADSANVWKISAGNEPPVTALPSNSRSIGFSPSG